MQRLDRFSQQGAQSSMADHEARWPRTFRRVLPWTVLSLLAGCGGGSEPPPDVPIPDQTYAVNVSYSSNSCGVTASFNPLTLHVGTRDDAAQLLSLLGEAVTSSRSGDKVTFSVPFPTSGVLKTLSGTWTFSDERHTFEGDITYGLVPTNGSACDFVFHATGGHHDSSELALPPTPDSPPEGSSNTSAGIVALGLMEPTNQASAIGTVPIGHYFGVSGRTGEISLQQPATCTGAETEHGRALFMTGIQANSQERDLGYRGSYKLFQAYRIWRWNGSSWDGIYDYAPKDPTIVHGFTEIFLPHPGAEPPPWSEVPGLKFPFTEGGHYYLAVQFVWVALFGNSFITTGGEIIGSLWVNFDDPSGYGAVGSATTGQYWCYIP